MIEEVICGDVLTRARAKRGDVQMLEGNRGGVEFRVAQTPIDYYLARSIISKREHRAADKLYRDFRFSGQSCGMTANLDPIRGGTAHFTEKQQDARDRWLRAILSINGTVARKIVVDVCCYGYWLKDTDYGHYKTTAAAMARFHEALDDLIKHYDELKKLLTGNSQ